PPSTCPSEFRQFGLSSHTCRPGSRMPRQIPFATPIVRILAGSNPGNPPDCGGWSDFACLLSRDSIQFVSFCLRVVVVWRVRVIGAARAPICDHQKSGLPGRRRAGFTLIDVLVSMTVVAVLIGI